MEILRVQPYGAIDAHFTVPSSFTEESDFTVVITDMADLSVQQEEYSGVAGDILPIELPALYDSDYRVEILSNGEVIFDETYELVRPYINPNTVATTASEIAKFAKNEQLARAIIDSIVGGFYYKKIVIETTGTGADYLPLWDDVKKILHVYENNVLVTDRAFEITSDKSAITEKSLELINRNESARIIIPATISDSPDFEYPFFRGFINGYDYKIVAEAGYTSVPSDIVRAAELLIDDIDCGRLDYHKRYVSAYNTEQFRIQFDKQSFEGTGNILVDKILRKYHKSITKLGVL